MSAMMMMLNAARQSSSSSSSSNHHRRLVAASRAARSISTTTPPIAAATGGQYPAWDRLRHRPPFIDDAGALLGGFPTSRQQQQSHHRRGLASRSAPFLDAYAPTDLLDSGVDVDDDGGPPPSPTSESSRRGRAPREVRLDYPADDDYSDDDGGRTSRHRHLHRHHLPKQSSHTTRILFDTLAPHVELRTLTKLTRRLSVILSAMNDIASTATMTTARYDSDDDAAAAFARAGREKALDGALDAVFGTASSASAASSSSSELEYTWTLRGQPWMRHALRAYLAGGKLDRPDRLRRLRRRGDDDHRHHHGPAGPGGGPPRHSTDAATPPLPQESDPTYPPNRNSARRRRDEDVDVLMDAREVSVYRHPIQWQRKAKRQQTTSAKSSSYEERVRERHRGKDDERLRAEAEDLLEVLSSSLPPPHFDKLMGRLGGFARLEDVGATTASSSSSRRHDGNVGEWYVDDDDDHGGDASSSSSSSSGGGAAPLPELPPSRAAANAEYKKRGIPALGKFLVDCSNSHAHLVGHAVARFFYVDVGDGKEVVAADLSAAIGRTPEGAAATAAVGNKKHRRPNLTTTTEKKYDKARDDFVVRMMGLQHELASREGSPAVVDNETASWKNVANEDGGIGGGIENGFGEDGDDASSDLSVIEFLKAQEPYSAESRREQREEVKGTLEELRRAGDEIGAENKMKGRGRPKIGVHLKFSAIRKEENGAPSSPDAGKSHDLKTETKLPSEDRLVFINNLPIDVSEEEIDEIYSRCGPLDSIRLFNLRPDLDPGPITTRESKERRRNKKLRNKNGESRHHRPRTPVYGIIRFQTDEGYRVATSQEMRIFGCVIRRHPVMSIMPGDMDTLYVEKIPTDLHSIDLENKLARLLQPHRVHIMLNGINGFGRNGRENDINVHHQEYSKPASCQVNFENFHTAWEAYHWINDEISDGTIPDENNESFEVHWFRTPSDSMDYWKRELGF